jgi:23S rRNA C2498 (ribose-2'-O)-methylase RlmM
MGGETVSEHQQHEQIRMIPHARTLRKARENIRWMVADQVSPAKIKRYFSRWLQWWVRTTITWDCQKLLRWFMEACWSATLNTYALALLLRYFKQSNMTGDAVAAA